MLSRINLQEIVVGSTLNFAMMGIGMLMIAYVHRSVPGIRQCGIGTLMVAAAFFSIALRDIVPEDGVLLLSHAMVLAGAVALCQGLRAFRGWRPLNYWAISLGAAASLAACARSLFVLDSLSGRVAAVSPFLSILMFTGAVTMAVGVPPKDRPAYWATALAFGIDGVVLVIRTVEALLVDLGKHYGEVGSLEVANVLTINIATAFGILGLFVSINLKLQRRIESLVLLDPLTGLPNRRHFERHYEEALGRTARAGRRLALVYMDLNDFKDINDRLGHEAGDEALRVVADRLSGVVRQSDCLVRLAGDEFVLLLEDVKSREEVVRLTRRLREAVQREAELAGERVSLSISCGFAIFPGDVDDVSHLMRRADAAMYAEKNARQDANRMIRPGVA